MYIFKMPAEFDRCVRKVSTQLRKDGADANAARLNAFAICTASFKKAGKPTTETIEKMVVRRDEDGHIIIAENVKLIIGGIIKEVIDVEED